MARRRKDGTKCQIARGAAGDALVIVCTLARAIQSLAVGSVDLGPEMEKERALLLPTIFTIGGVLGHGLIHVSPDFPFTAEEMTTATTPHIISGSAACSVAVDEAIERISPMMLDVAAHFAATYPEEHKALGRLIVGDVGPHPLSVVNWYDASSRSARAIFARASCPFWREFIRLFMR